MDVGAVTCMRVAKRMDVETVADIRLELKPLLSTPGHVVLDLRGARMDTSGLGAVISMKWRLEQLGRKLVVVGDEPGLRSLVERAGVGCYLPVYTDMDEARMTLAAA